MNGCLKRMVIFIIHHGGGNQTDHPASTHLLHLPQGQKHTLSNQLSQKATPKQSARLSTPSGNVSFIILAAFQRIRSSTCLVNALSA